VSGLGEGNCPKTFASGQPGIVPQPTQPVDTPNFLPSWLIKALQMPWIQHQLMRDTLFPPFLDSTSG